MPEIDTKIFRTISQKFHLAKPLRVQRFKSGQVNRVYGLNEKLVVKIQGQRDGQPEHVIEHQPQIIERLQQAGARVSPLLDHGEIEDIKYLVLGTVAGRNLVYLWPQASVAEQDRYMGQIAEQMQIFHSISAPAYQIPIAENPPEKNLRQALDKDTAFAKINPAKLAPQYRADYELLRGFYASHLSLLDESGTAVFVHNDMHFENIFFDGQRLSGVIDFDWCAYGPKDLELKKLLDFAHTPRNYVEDELQAIYNNRQETQAIHLLRRHYPSLFETPDLADRVRLYEIGILLWVMRGFLDGLWSNSAIENVHQRVDDFFRTGWLERTIGGQ